MKTIKLQGKDYVQVVERLKYFNENYKEGRIHTSCQIINDHVIFKADVIIDNQVKATGHGMKSIKSEFNFEKAETRAIGRALGIFGIGADNSISTYDEVSEAIAAEKNDNKELADKARQAFRGVNNPTDKLKEWIAQVDTLTNEQIIKGIQKMQALQAKGE